MTADNLKNLGGRIQGKAIRIAARNDLLNLGGSITASDSLSAQAGHDLTVESATRTQTNAHGSRTHIDRVAGLYVTGEKGTLLASAGNDLSLLAAVVQSQGSVTLAAGNNVNLGTATEASSNRITWDGSNRRSDRTTAEVGTAVQSQGDIRIIAGQDINARAARVTSDKGMVSAQAGRDIKLTAGQATAEVDEAHQHSEKGFLSKKTITTRDTLDQLPRSPAACPADRRPRRRQRSHNTWQQHCQRRRHDPVRAKESDDRGGTRNTYRGPRPHRDEIRAPELRRHRLHDRHTRTGRGSEDREYDRCGQHRRQYGCNITLSAGETYRQVGSDVLAPQGDVAITGKQVDILEARETRRNETKPGSRKRESRSPLAAR